MFTHINSFHLWNTRIQFNEQTNCVLRAEQSPPAVNDWMLHRPLNNNSNVSVKSSISDSFHSPITTMFLSRKLQKSDIQCLTQILWFPWFKELIYNLLMSVLFVGKQLLAVAYSHSCMRKGKMAPRCWNFCIMLVMGCTSQIYTLTENWKPKGSICISDEQLNIYPTGNDGIA